MDHLEEATSELRSDEAYAIPGDHPSLAKGCMAVPHPTRQAFSTRLQQTQGGSCAQHQEKEKKALCVGIEILAALLVMRTKSLPAVPIVLFSPFTIRLLASAFEFLWGPVNAPACWSDPSFVGFWGTLLLSEAWPLVG